jgi:hypothetical protein
MKKNPYQLLFAFLLALFLGTGTTYAYDFSKTISGKTFYFNITNSTQHYVEITYPGTNISLWDGYTKPSGNITLPSSVTYNNVTYTVTAIGDYAFYECSGLTGSLTIPNSVTTIGSLAFAYCSGFNGTLSLPSSLTTIDYGAFGWCPNFTGSLTIPNSVIFLGDFAFYQSGFTGSLTIGNSVPSIGQYAFSSCGFTGTLTIGSSVTSIGTSAFHGCHGFTGSLVIPDSVTTIGEWAFYSCDGMTGTLTLGSSLTTICDKAFWSTDFTGSLTIPNSVTTIGMLAFGWNTGFNGTLTIGTGVTSIGNDAFKRCFGFTKLNYNAINCADVAPDDNGDYVSPFPFTGCIGTLSIGSYVQRIPAYMFCDCNGFWGSLTIPNSVTTIGECAFKDCSGFDASLNLGNSVTTIGAEAFYGCESFTGSLTIPNSMTSIGEKAFYNCSGFTTMTVNPETPPTLGSNVFYYVPKSIPVKVPCSALSDYQTAEGWSDFTNYQCNHMVTVTAVPTAGGMVTGGGTYLDGTEVTVTASPSNNYVFMNWTKNGTVVSCNTSHTFTVEGDTELEAVFVAQSNLGTIIGEATGTQYALPSHSYYKNSLTEQIYTASEMGGSRTITNISFFNETVTKTRTYDIYMMHTTKTEFSSTTDWVSVTSSYKVFSGSVTMRAGAWTTIVLNAPFSYNGSSNLLLVVDDNSGTYTPGPHMACRTYATSGNQAIRVFSDGTNYNPSSPSSYSGVLVQDKNQIMLNRTAYSITATSGNTTAGTVSGGGAYGKGDLCTLQATAISGYTFVAWVNNEGDVVSTDANYSFFVTGNKTLVAHFTSGTDVCHLTFDLHDSYGDGWNDNHLVVNCANGINEWLAVPYGEHDATFTLPVVDGSHVTLSWVEGAYMEECSFALRDANDLPLFVASNLNADYEYEFDMNCAGMSSEFTYVGDHSTANNYYLPSYSYYCYALSEQIYTADEIGGTGLINCIALYNQGAEKTRYYKIYLATTDKTSFESQTDWISTNDATLVYSGNVNMYAGKWTPIIFDTQFEYDGVSNLVLIVDDNTGSYTSAPHMSCRVYEAGDLQALRVFSDNYNYDPSNPLDDVGALVSVKNQIMFNIARSEQPMDMTVALSAGTNWVSFNVETDLDDLKAALVDALSGTSNIAITIQGKSQNTKYTGGRWRGTLNFDVTQMYMIDVSADCEITLEGLPVNPSEHPVTIVNGANWIAYPLDVSMTQEEAFAGFNVVNGDVISAKGGNARYTGGRWRGTVTLTPGQGYIYTSAASGNRILTFPSGNKTQR